MIFWALIAIIVAATVGTFIKVAREDDGLGFAFAFAFLALMGSGVASVLIFMGCAALLTAPTSKDLSRDDTYQLRSLGTASGVEGRSYFLGGGYINSKRVLNYITDESGAIRVRQSEADASTIYEDTTQPTVNVKHYDERYGWLMPFVVPTHDEYTFHVPAGSVMSDYTVTNK